MNSGIPALESATDTLLTVTMIVLGIFLFACLLRSVIGPRIADRIVAVNMMGTMIMVIIGILAIYLGEGYLVDICIIYAMLSFLAVVVICKVYMGVYREKQIKKEEEEKNE